ncbi:MAG: ABC transporter substrate-binding protein [Candidatus Thorarchaeota archaeon]
MEQKQAAAIGIVVIILGSVALIAFWNPAPEPDVRIGYLSKDIHQLALRVALENGYFEREGIIVELVQYGNGAQEMDGFAGGQIDMGYLGAAPALTKRLNQDIMITILAAANLEGSAIMVSKSEFDAGHVTSISDLVGKGVYQPGPSTVQNFLLRLALNQSGLSYDDITPLSTTSISTMADSLTPENPAFIAWEPFNALAEYQNKAVPLVLSGDIWPRHPCCVVAAENTFLSEHPDIVEEVIQIHQEATDWIATHPTEAIAIAIDWLEMDETPVTTAFNRVIFDYDVNVTGIEMYLDFLISQDLIENVPSNIPEFLDGFINATYVEAPLLCC